MTQDVSDECRPAAGAENHWFKHNDHGYRLYERISGTALGTFWMYRDFGGKSETLAAEGWTYHIRAYLTADPDRAARDAVVEAARRVVHWSGALELCAPELGAAHTAIFALCAAVAAMPKEGE